MSTRTCAWGQCESEVHARGLCEPCYKRVRNMKLLDLYPRVNRRSIDVHTLYVQHVVRGGRTVAWLAAQLGLTRQGVQHAVKRARAKLQAEGSK